ncbi:MAG: hypothetical protein AB8B63_18790 [Granulosicoccus sp.]
MDRIILLVGALLLIAAIRSHMMTQVNVITKTEKQWFERLFTGSRPSKDNLTEEGLRYRKQSNLYAVAGFLLLGLYVFVSS